ncbi:ABC transporter ATP-binding protein [Amnibacterium flavum]|uniref:Fatty acid ABC transporter ATP-binding/permease protein n=1 Tax=Amnibacterium flavum TaxID=2173173 RepID=A0A2V1HWX0_9MICO|nr:ABC transporter ATP-binding protein [Amnibacterium flavum]PVZ95700.1 ABC transporter [Amnibacterium flavum]
MSGGGRPRRGVASSDTEAQKAANATAPKVDHLLRRIGHLFAPHRAMLTLTIALVLIDAALTVAPPLLTQQAFDRGLFPEGGPNIPVLAELVGLMILIWVVSAGLGIWQTYLTATIGNNVMGTMRVDLFRHLQAMELGFFTRTKTGVIQSRLANDVGGVAGVLSNTVSSVIGNLVTVIAALVAMLLLSWQLTLIAVVLLPLLALAQRRVGRVRARIATQTQESLSDMTAITQETLSVSGILLAKSFGRQESETERYAGENRRQIGLQVRQAMSGQGFFALVQIFLSIVPAVIYLVSAYLIEGGADLTAGTIVAFTTVQARLMWPLLGLMRVALDLQTSAALFARIFEYFDLRPTIADPAVPESIGLGDPVGRVEFRDVAFSYPDQTGSHARILKDVSFVAEPGQRIAFVGASGAGKTTISYLIPRFYDATGGAVMMGGHDVRNLRQQEVLDQIGIVSQETYLFHATIRENLLYAKPDATEGEMRRAAEAASISATIEAFPDGYDTVVGERGYRLSGGEKQRIAIARVLLKDPPVLLLDEATSALDSVSERAVQEALDEASAGRTTIAIAHRLSTVVDADIIHVVDRGRIVESGTHDDLLARGGAYAALAARQGLTTTPRQDAALEA